MHLEADGAAEAPAAQLHLHLREEVVGFTFGQREVGVAGDAEGVVLDDLHAGEQDRELVLDDLLERHETVTVREREEAWEQRRHLDPREAAVPGAGVEHVHAQVQRQVRDVREGVRGVDGQRRQHREDALLEDLLDMLAIGLVELVPRQQLDTRIAQGRHEPFEEHRLLLADDLLHAVADLDRAAGPGCARPVTSA